MNMLFNAIGGGVGVSSFAGLQNSRTRRVHCCLARKSSTGPKSSKTNSAAPQYSACSSSILHGPSARRGVVVYAGPDDKPEVSRTEESPSPAKGGLPEDDIDEGLIGAIGTWILWAGLVAYMVYAAPNQTPLRDSYFLEKLSGFGSNDGVVLNPILVSVFFLDRALPPIYGALLSPSAKNGNWLPSWPFLSGAMLFGSFSLLPYFAMWEPSSDVPKVPPKASNLSLSLRITESPLFAGALVLGCGILLAQIGLASGQRWYEFGRLLEESRLVHATTVDLFTLTFALPFWMYNDASARGFKQQQVLPLLIALPCIGPAIYLLLRPKAGDSGDNGISSD